MGIISDLANNTKAFPGADGGRALWRQVFAGLSKEDLSKFPTVRGAQPTVPGGSWGRSSLTTDESTKRLLQALRSMAPGGWTDNRWEQTGHFVGISYVGIHRTAMQLAQAEFQVFVEDDAHPDGKRPVTKFDPPQGDRQVRPYDLIRLLKHPNKQDSFGNMFYRVHQQKGLTGTALIWMVPNALGTPMELFVIPTALAIPQPAVNPDYPDGYYRIQPVYPYGPFSSYPTPASAVGAAIPAQWMMRIQYPHPLLRYEGYSPLTAMRLHIDEIESVDKSRFYTMKRSVRPSAVLNFKDNDQAAPLPPEEIERIHAEWENEHAGPENVNKLIVCPPGGELDSFGNLPVDMDYQNGWDQLMNFILGGAFGITKPAAGMVEDNSYSTLFATLKQLHLLTLQPECNDFAHRLTQEVAPHFGDNLIVEIRCSRIDDHEIKKQKIDQLISAKAITKNEVRKENEMPLTEEEWGGEIAGFEKPPEQPMGMPGAPGQPGQPGQTGPQGDSGRPVPPEIIGGESEEEGELPEPPEVTKTRPSPGKLGEGALGPRKSFAPKSLYARVREALATTNGRK